MALVCKNDTSTTYTSPDGSIFIDFDAVDNEKKEECDEEEESE